MTAWQQWRIEQREKLIQQRINWTSERSVESQKTVFHHLQRVLEPLPKGIIGFYWPIKGEIDCRDFVTSLITLGWQAALPKIVARHQPLQFRQWHPQVDMQKEIWEIPVPQNTPIVQPDVLLIPLVGFDRKLHRLGNGGGFYDRTLAGTPKPLAIGIGYEWMLLDNIQPQSHDIPMDRIVTEQAVYPA